MRYLLDTHTFIWLDSASVNLTPKVRTLVQDTDNTILVSLASIWEMQIKHQLGKLQLRLPLADIIRHQQETNRVEILAITLAHILGLENLPAHHKDPFDRLLIAPAMVEGVAVVSHDPVFAQYPIPVIW